MIEMANVLPMIIGMILGIFLTTIWFMFGQIRRIKSEHEIELNELQQLHLQNVELAKKRSVNTSRAVLKGKMAEQFAPFFPEFTYLPSDAKFLGDPVDYVVFSGYSEFREGLKSADEIEVVLIDIKSGQARLTKGQQAIAQAIEQGRVRFETIRIDIED